MRFWKRLRTRRDRRRSLEVAALLRERKPTPEGLEAMVRAGEITEAERVCYATASDAAKTILAGVAPHHLEALVRAFGDGIPTNERLEQMLANGEITAEDLGILVVCLAEAELRSHA